jgi:predicted RNA-binding Zn ribbon-like protein
MPLSEQRGEGVAIGVDLVNSWDELHSEPELLSERWLRRWLAWHRMYDAAEHVSEQDLPRARDLRERLARAFDATGEEEAVAALNELAAEVGSPPRLERENGGWGLRAWPQAESLDAAAARAALGMLEAIRDLGWKRFGRCAGEPCHCAFVDRSRNRSRRYCCELCADRVAQANYRRRKAKA